MVEATQKALSWAQDEAHKMIMWSKSPYGLRHV